jgi:single-stranded DNA-binding protein
MSVAILLSGSLFRAPERRTSQSGKSYVVTTIKATTTDNSGSDFWSALAFGTTAGEELMRLAVGERVTIQGGLKLETYTASDGTTKISRTIFVDHVMALRQPPKERKPKKAAAPEGLPLERNNIVPASAPTFDDDIPF